MQKKRINIGGIISYIFIIIFLVLIVVSVYNIAIWYKSNKDNKKIQEIIEKSITIENIKDDTNESKAKYNIDWNTLKSQNSDVVAYLKVNNTNIDYIVVKTNNNDFYLNHNFNKKYNVSGWIFADFHNIFDGSDKNIIIYGHNTKNDSMFGTLKNVLDKSWYENKDNQIITLITKDKEYYYQVFSTYSIIPEDYYINTEFKSAEEFEKFINTLKSRSIYDYNVEVSTSDKILTLSSCLVDASKRVVLHAKEIALDK